MRRQSVAIFFALSVLVSGCAPSSQAQTKAPGRYVEQFNHDGVNRNYILRIPKAAETGKPMPVVLALHGWTGSAVAAEQYMNLVDEAEKRGYIIVFPDGLGTRKGWNAGFIDLSGQKKDDVGFLATILDRVEKDSKVDLDRVFLCGHSNGAFMSHYAAAVLSDRIAAIGAVAGTIGVGERSIPKPAKGKPSVLMIHSLNDNTVAYDAESESLLKGVPQPKGAAWWAEQLGIGSRVTKEEFPENKGTIEIWGTSVAAPQVQLVSLKDGGHAWPGGRTISGPERASGVSAANLIFDFFDKHPRFKS
jgi:polyhydroxybutyrate depolymerase